MRASAREIGMGLFDGVKGAKVTAGSDRLRHGKYVFAVEKYISKASADNPAVTNVIAELRVIEAQKVGNGEPNAVGSLVGYLNQIGNPKTAKVWASNLKGFFMGLLGATDAEIDPEIVMLIEAAVNEDPAKGAVNPLRGRKIGATTYDHKAKTSGTDLILPRWITIPMTSEEIAASCKALDAEAAKVSVPVAPPAAPAAIPPPAAAPTGRSLLGGLLNR